MSSVAVVGLETSGVKKSDTKTSGVEKIIYKIVDRSIYIILVCVLLINLISYFNSPTWLLIIISIIFLILYGLLDYIGAI